MAVFIQSLDMCCIIKYFLFQFSPIYSLGPPWPPLDEPMECDNDETFENLARFLEKRINTRNTLVADHKEQSEFASIAQKGISVIYSSQTR